MSQSVEKKAARQSAAKKRDSYPEPMRFAWSDTACQRAVEWLQERPGPTVRSVMIYVPFRSELDPTLLVEWCWRKGIEVAAPRCIQASRGMELYRLQAWDELTPGAYGIKEPDPAAAQRCEPDWMPDIVFVPGLAFDKRGGRLGYGGGYYDRFHERLVKLAADSGRPMPEWIGLGYEAQWSDDPIPMDDHDAYVDAVITEHGLTRRSKAWN
ncbi:5-formyltetrahydrofolate cyclo-ligase [Paenibacillus montanisoli]|uniref:5-formyltetrahydrofolate cyclo-ligase n=1 Tax=Paenibacillus montanisoli TaxID=2081970 RepID=A0A328TT57_9BACL|nr:5-formyltetrahydrofolate cyclo-ligase [Paenibacillus montanisoli]RAP73737.1 5-formyltetrahydrofolate cyclo-ligase [Paenibacillus montanisoli]